MAERFQLVTGGTAHALRVWALPENDDMQTTPITEPATAPLAQNSDAHRNRAVKILAKSIFRELSAQGYSEKQIVSLATELIGAVTREISSGSVD